MDYEYFLRCLYYLAKFIATAPEACQALSKGWKSFTEFLESIDGYGEGQQSLPPPENITLTPVCGTLRINVFDTVEVGGSASCSAILS